MQLIPLKISTALLQCSACRSNYKVIAMRLCSSATVSVSYCPLADLESNVCFQGWDRGVEGMRVGDKRRLTVPASMGYGSSGAAPSIPPNATLIFDVELCNVL